MSEWKSRRVPTKEKTRRLKRTIDMILTESTDRLKTLPSRNLSTLMAEVNQHHRAFQELLTDVLDHAKAAGDVLIKIKASLPHGEFGKWISENCEFSDRTARRYILIAEGWDRLDANRTRVRNLSVRQAVKLLTDDGDHGNSPHKWEPKAGEVRIGVTPDGRMVVLRSIDDPRYIRTAVIDVDGGFSDYDRRGVNRDYLVRSLGHRGVNPDAVEWFPNSDADAEIVTAAFGEDQ